MPMPGAWFSSPWACPPCALTGSLFLGNEMGIPFDRMGGEPARAGDAGLDRGLHAHAGDDLSGAPQEQVALSDAGRGAALRAVVAGSMDPPWPVDGGA